MRACGHMRQTAHHCGTKWRNIILSDSEKHHIEQGEIHHFTNSAAFFGNRKRFLRRSRRKITGRSCKKRHPTSGGCLLFFCLDKILFHQVVGHGAEEFDDLGDIAFIEIIGAAVGNACDGTAHTDEGCFAAVALDAV